MASQASPPIEPGIVFRDQGIAMFRFLRCWRGEYKAFRVQCV